MKKIIPIFAIVGMLLSATTVLATSGSTSWSGNGNFWTQVSEGTAAQQNVGTSGTGLSGSYNWNTDIWSGRGTGLVGTVDATASSGSVMFDNSADFSQMTGSGYGYQDAFAGGNNVDFEVNYGRHQGYAITSGTDLHAEGTYLIYHDMLLEDASHTTKAYHYLDLVGSGTGDVENDMWNHAAVRAQGITYDSDGGWGATGWPKVTAIGSGTFSQQGYGSNYLSFDGMILPGGGSASAGATFTGGFSFQNFKVRANSGGI